MTGNKGEWSEIYVFLKLLADGRLNAADANLNAIKNIYYPIIKILRQENENNREYKINGNIKIINGNNGKEIMELPITEFVKYSKNLFEKINSASGRSFAIEDIEEFLNSIDINSLTAKKSDKEDIRVVVHDLNTGLEPQLGFSIKSMLGGKSTLFNPGKTTNFIYEVLGKDSIDISEINAIVKEPKISSRINTLRERGFKIVFSGIQSKTLQLNLQLIDSDLPKILAELLLLKYSASGKALLSNLLSKLVIKNPLNFDLSQGHPFYEYKIKKFLTDSALGMTPATKWTGKYDATGGIIIVKQSGELVCYHIYNRNEFQNYLLNSTRLEQAATGRNDFGYLYRKENRLFIKLNLQIRFNQ